MAEPTKQGKIYWHDAFFEAIQLELNDYEHQLTFQDEKQLSKEALIMDVLIVKKESGVNIEKNIGRIFKSSNIFEFKSEKDKLEIWDYNKVVGYANIYSAFEKIPLSDITLTFVATVKPVKLLKHLEQDRNFQVKETQPGIYYIIGDHYPVQIIESKKLTAEENIFIKSLRSNLSNDDLECFMYSSQKYALSKTSALMNRVIEANKEVLEEVLSMSEEVLKIYTKVLKEKGLYEQVTEDRFEEGVEGAIKMLSRLGLSQSQAITEIQTTYNLTPEQATNYINRFYP